MLLAYGGGSVKRSGLYDEVFRILRRAGKQVADLPDIPPGPTYEKALEGAGLVRENGIDLILAVGGGSVWTAARRCPWRRSAGGTCGRISGTGGGWWISPPCPWARS